RNRTSPFAFTGNRFEFRAPGSLQSVAGPMVTINTILAEALEYIADSLDKAIGEGAEFNAAVQTVLEEIITVHGGAVFNGDGYSEDWQVEAAARGLPNLKTTLDALPELISVEALELFSKYDVFSHREMHSRYEIALEQYALSIGVEARLTLEMGQTTILPAALRYQTELAGNVATLAAAGIDPDRDTLNTLTKAVTSLKESLLTLRSELSQHHETPLLEAEHAQGGLLPAMLDVRRAADELEHFVADDLWPLPTYQEMLFIL
ncbi:MAG: glutamine synthetase, partial [Frankiales bacterium]|nr:glutamine synthetase [Frankiales bacterium]